MVALFEVRVFLSLFCNKSCNELSLWGDIVVFKNSVFHARCVFTMF